MVLNARLHTLRAAGLTVASLLICGGLAVQPAAAGDFDTVPSKPQVLEPEPDTGTDQFIVGVKDNAAKAAKATVDGAAEKAAGKLGAATESTRENATGGHVIKLRQKLSAAAAETFAQTLRSDPSIAYAEPDAIMHPASGATDPGYPSQWSLWNSVGGLRIPGAWNYNHGEGVVVAVVDTGITSHPDLNGNVLPGYDMISDAADARDGDGRDPDPTDVGDWEPAGVCEAGSPENKSSWHGTHVAGTIAAVANNGEGITGVAPGANILPVRAMSFCGGYTSDIADSIVWAAGGVVDGVPANQNPAKIINLSLGGKRACSATYQNAINFAHNAGAAVIVAAGNSNRPAAEYSPANCQNVITVAASDKSGARAPYSNYGSTVDVTAPGGNMSSDYLNGIVSTSNFGTSTAAAPAYSWMQGTSMAAPHVAGIAALLYSAEGANLTPALLEQQLKNASRPLPAGCPAGCGAGLIDATAALKASGAGIKAGAGKKNNDFDGDGTADVLARTLDGALVLYQGNGSGGWRQAYQIGSGWNGMTAIELAGDFNGDGMSDVIARGSNGVLWLYPGNGAGGWLPAQQIGSGWNVMTAIEAPGDFNGDGNADIIARASNGVLWLYPGNGLGGWLPAQQIGWGWDVMTAIDGVGDFNGDGNADIIARNSSGGLFLYPGNGSGGWLPSKQIGWGWNGITAIEGPGDFDGDGKVDVLGRTSSGDLMLYRGTGSGSFGNSYRVGAGWNVMNVIL